MNNSSTNLFSSHFFNIIIFKRICGVVKYRFWLNSLALRLGKLMHKVTVIKHSKVTRIILEATIKILKLSGIEIKNYRNNVRNKCNSWEKCVILRKPCHISKTHLQLTYSPNKWKLLCENRNGTNVTKSKFNFSSKLSIACYGIKIRFWYKETWFFIFSRIMIFSWYNLLASRAWTIITCPCHLLAQIEWIV